METLLPAPDLSVSISVPVETGGSGGLSWAEYLGVGSAVCAGVGGVCVISWLAGRWCR